MSTSPKITVRFDGIDDPTTAAAIATQLETGEITVADLFPLDDTATALLATAIETHAETGEEIPMVCAIDLGDLGAGGDGLMGDLCDSETNKVIRSAIPAEMVASLRAGADGHILVDGRKVYVA